ncbi:MAG: hypothetical protein KF823_11920 [Xanthomonadales bacterium]|nr:hypothetical protein [Xanthomonadales bacterium]
MTGRRVTPPGHDTRQRLSIGTLVVALALSVVLSRPLAFAQPSSDSYTIPRQSIDGGAGRATSASHTLRGSIGQPDAGAPMSSASFSLRGGFHRLRAPTEPTDRIFANGFEPP